MGKRKVLVKPGDSLAISYKLDVPEGIFVTASPTVFNVYHDNDWNIVVEYED